MRQSPRPPLDQSSLFGAEVTDPRLADLSGLLVGPGTVQRMGGTARVTVPVDAAWRVHVLVAELARRGLTATWEPDGTGYVVHTSYAAGLVRLAQVWQAGTPQGGTPVGLRLTGHALRLWAAAAGVPAPVPPHPGYLLPLGGGTGAEWSVVGGALRAVGVAAALVVPGVDGAAAAGYRVTGGRRLARLAELVGDPPPAAPAGAWPAP